MGRNVHLHSHPSRVQHWRHIVEIAAIAGAAIWALYVFVYQERIKPANEPPEFQPAFALEHTRLPSGKEFVKVHVDAKNAGQTTIYLAGLVVNVYGVGFNERTGTEIVSSSTDALFDRTLLPTNSTLLYSTGTTMQPFGNRNNFVILQPGTTYAGSLAFVVPPKGLDAVRIQWQICFSKIANKSWRMPLERQRDGSYWFEDKYDEANGGSGLICYDDRHEYYPL